MKQSIIARYSPIFLGMLLLACSSSSLATLGAGTVSCLDTAGASYNDVWISDTQGNFRQASLGSQVAMGETVMTGLGTDACISYTDNSTVYMSENSGIILDEYFNGSTDSIVLRVLNGVVKWDWYTDTSLPFAQGIQANNNNSNHTVITNNSSGRASGGGSAPKANPLADPYSASLLAIDPFNITAGAPTLVKNSIEVTEGDVSESGYDSNQIILREGDPIEVVPLPDFSSLDPSLFAAGTEQDISTIDTALLFAAASAGGVSAYLSDNATPVILSTPDTMVQTSFNDNDNGTIAPPAVDAPAYNGSQYSVPEPPFSVLVGVGLLIGYLQRRKINGVMTKSHNDMSRRIFNEIF